jgi:hypothetical protein
VTITLQDVERAKVEGRYRYAGQLQALAGCGIGTDYGCHYGMRSEREIAKQLFNMGFNEVHFYLSYGDVDPQRR